MKWISLAWLLVMLSATTASAENETDAALRKYFPKRDLTKAAIKIVDYKHNVYVVGDSFEVLKNGTVRTTNAAILVKLDGPNESPRFSIYDGAKMILTFEKPVKSIWDLDGNRLKSHADVSADGPNNRMD